MFIKISCVHCGETNKYDVGIDLLEESLLIKMSQRKKILILTLVILFTPCLAVAGDEQAINTQLQQGGVVHLSAGTYTLTDSIILQDNTVLEGDPGAVLTIPNNACWPAWKPLISGEGKHNITIRNLEIDGNSENNNFLGLHGKGYYVLIHVIDCDSITVNNCLLHDGDCDGLRTKTSTNIKFYNNTAYRLGHDCFYGIESQNIEAYNNRLTTRTNSALRIWNSAHVRFFDNIIDAQLDSLGGNPGIQIEDSTGILSDVEICKNILSKTWGSGIWLIAYETGLSNTQAVSIHHNLFWQPAQSYNICYAAGITIDGEKGTQIQNNCFDGSCNAAILDLSGGQGSVIQNNIITDTTEHKGIKQEGTGYGITDRSGASLSIMNNCFYANQNGNLYCCTSSGDDLQDPKEHKTSSGWTWTGTTWTWTGTTWTCEKIKPLDLEAITPAQPANHTDTDTHEFTSNFGILNKQFSDSGRTEPSIIPQKPIIAAVVMTAKTTH